MADTATATATAPAPAPAAAAAAAGTAADKKKPEKPNAELFNERLAKAEKEYQDSMAKYVRWLWYLPFSSQLWSRPLFLILRNA